MLKLKRTLSIVIFICVIFFQVPVLADDNLEDDGEVYEINELLTAVRSRCTKGARYKFKARSSL